MAESSSPSSSDDDVIDHLPPPSIPSTSLSLSTVSSTHSYDSRSSLEQNNYNNNPVSLRIEGTSSNSRDSTTATSVAGAGGPPLTPTIILSSLSLSTTSSLPAAVVTCTLTASSSSSASTAKATMSNVQANKCLNEKRRREQENGYIEELAELISARLSETMTSSLSVKPDKAAILQETVKQIKIIQQDKDDLQASEVSSSMKPTIIGNEGLGLTLLLEALDGFLFVVNQDGKIECVSENVQNFLNYTSSELTGESIYNYLAIGDHARFSSSLLPMSAIVTTTNSNNNNSSITSSTASSSLTTTSTASSVTAAVNSSSVSKSRTFNARFRIKGKKQLPEESYQLQLEQQQQRERQESMLTEEDEQLFSQCVDNGYVGSSSRTIVNASGEVYENMQISAVLLPYPKVMTGDGSSPSSLIVDPLNSDREMSLVCVARRMPLTDRTPSNIQVEQFSTRLDLTGKILAIDTSGVSSTYSQHLNKDLIGKGLLELCHRQDLHKLRSHLEEALRKHTPVTSPVYRLMVAPDRYVCVQTKSRLFAVVNRIDEEYVMATHSIIRDSESTTNSTITSSSLSSISSQSASVSPMHTTPSSTSSSTFSRPIIGGDPLPGSVTVQETPSTSSSSHVVSSASSSSEVVTTSNSGYDYHSMSPSTSHVDCPDLEDCLGLTDMFPSSSWSEFGTEGNVDSNPSEKPMDIDDDNNNPSDSNHNDVSKISESRTCTLSSEGNNPSCTTITVSVSSGRSPASSVAPTSTTASPRQHQSQGNQQRLNNPSHPSSSSSPSPVTESKSQHPQTTDSTTPTTNATSSVAMSPPDAATSSSSSTHKLRNLLTQGSLDETSQSSVSSQSHDILRDLLKDDEEDGGMQFESSASTTTPSHPTATGTSTTTTTTVSASSSHPSSSSSMIAAAPSTITSPSPSSSSLSTTAATNTAVSASPTLSALSSSTPSSSLHTTSSNATTMTILSSFNNNATTSTISTSANTTTKVSPSTTTTSSNPSISVKSTNVTTPTTTSGGNNDMLRKLLNDDDQAKSYRKSSQQDILQQLLRENSDTQGSDGHPSFPGTPASADLPTPGHPLNRFSGPSSVKRKSVDESGGSQPSTPMGEGMAKRPAPTSQSVPSRPQTQQQLAQQNPMLANMLAESPKSLPPAPPVIKIPTSIVSAVPQERLPKNLEKKLVHTPAGSDGMVVVSSHGSLGGIVSPGHPTGQFVVMSQPRSTPINIPNIPGLGPVSQHRFQVQAQVLQSVEQQQQQQQQSSQQQQGFLNKMLVGTGSSTIVSTIPSPGTVGGFQPTITSQHLQQPPSSIPISIQASSVGPSVINTSSFNRSTGALGLPPSSVVTVTASSSSTISSNTSSSSTLLFPDDQQSDPMLSDILDQVWSLQQEMDTVGTSHPSSVSSVASSVPTLAPPPPHQQHQQLPPPSHHQQSQSPDDMLLKILDEVLEPSNPNVATPSNLVSTGVGITSTPTPTTDMNEKLRISEIQRQLMSVESVASPNMPVGLHPQQHPLSHQIRGQMQSYPQHQGSMQPPAHQQYMFSPQSQPGMIANQGPPPAYPVNPIGGPPPQQQIVSGPGGIVHMRRGIAPSMSPSLGPPTQVIAHRPQQQQQQFMGSIAGSISMNQPPSPAFSGPMGGGGPTPGARMGKGQKNERNPTGLHNPTRGQLAQQKRQQQQQQQQMLLQQQMSMPQSSQSGDMLGLGTHENLNEILNNTVAPNVTVPMKPRFQLIPSNSGSPLAHHQGSPLGQQQQLSPGQSRQQPGYTHTSPSPSGPHPPPPGTFAPVTANQHHPASRMSPHPIVSYTSVSSPLAGGPNSPATAIPHMSSPQPQFVSCNSPNPGHQSWVQGPPPGARGPVTQGSRLQSQNPTLNAQLGGPVPVSGPQVGPGNPQRFNAGPPNPRGPSGMTGGRPSGLSSPGPRLGSPLSQYPPSPAGGFQQQSGPQQQVQQQQAGGNQPGGPNSRLIQLNPQTQPLTLQGTQTPRSTTPRANSSRVLNSSESPFSGGSFQGGTHIQLEPRTLPSGQQFINASGGVSGGGSSTAGISSEVRQKLGAMVGARSQQNQQQVMQQQQVTQQSQPPSQQQPMTSMTSMSTASSTLTGISMSSQLTQADIDVLEMSLDLGESSGLAFASSAGDSLGLFDGLSGDLLSTSSPLTTSVSTATSSGFMRSQSVNSPRGAGDLSNDAKNKSSLLQQLLSEPS